MDRNREQHVEWCKERALAYLDNADLDNAFNSMISDLNNHTYTKEHPAIIIGFMLRMSGGLSTVQEMRKFIVGFH